jgi:HSP20 family protein
MIQSAAKNVEGGKNEAAGSPERLDNGVTYIPRVDILETEKELVLFADLPGCKPEDIDVRYENGQFEIHGKCPQRNENVFYLLSEYDVGDYYRSFTVSDTIDPNKIEAAYKQGVLTVHLPKSAAEMPSRIPVKAE